MSNAPGLSRNEKGDLVYSSDPKVFSERIELTFRQHVQYPLLCLPDATSKRFDNTKDYVKSIRETPFSFCDFIEPQEIPKVIVKEQELDRTEYRGLPPDGFDEEKYNATRKRIPCLNYIPYPFQRNLPPLRDPAQYLEKEKILDAPGIFGGNVGVVTFIRVCDVILSPKQRKNLGKHLSQYTHLEVLILRNVGLKKLNNFAISTLRYCDLSHNKIKSLRSVLTMLSRSPDLEVFNLSGNPVVKESEFREKVIAMCPLTLQYLNGAEIEILETMRAILLYGRKEHRQNIDTIHYDMVLQTLPEIYQMTQWQPEYITRLSLEGLHLTTLHVGSFSNLVHLNAARNRIERLRCSGLEWLDKLIYVDLSGNLIADKKELYVFAYTPSLQSLYLEDNPTLANYRLFVVYLTRNLRGTNRCTGLVELDGQEVTVDERVRAVELFANSRKKVDTHMLRWELVLMATFGHRQIRTPGFFRNVVRLDFRATGLVVADLRPLAADGSDGGAALEWLDLSRNHLVAVHGLEKLVRLRYVDLSDNPRLPLKQTLAALKRLSTLEHVALADFAAGHVPNMEGAVASDVAGGDEAAASLGNAGMAPAGDSDAASSNAVSTLTLSTHTAPVEAPKNSKRLPSNRKYRQKVLEALLGNNARLVALDRQLVEVAERTLAYKELGQLTSAEQVEHYRLHLALLMNAAPLAAGRRYAPVDVLVATRPYDAGGVTALRRLHHCGLVSLVCDFRAFCRLEELNLSHNRLNTLTGLGIETLPHLRILDVSYNAIATPLKDLAALFDVMATQGALECLAVRGNPALRHVPDDRRKLIGLMRAMREVTCRLRVIDTEVTVSERAEAWRLAGGSPEECEQLKFRTVMFLRVPPNTAPKDVTQLDLNDADLAAVDLSTFTSLEVLLLKGNRLKTVDSVKGLLTGQLSRLKVVDLRDNQLARIDDVVRLVDALPELATLGVRGNKFSKDPSKYRLKLLKRLPQLHRPGNAGAALRVLDDDVITDDELVRAWKGDALPAEEKKFRVLLLRRVPRSFQEKWELVEELDLSRCDLASVDLSGFRSLKRLSLKGNQLTNAAVQKSNIHQLASLRAVDLSNNKIKKMSPLAALLDHLPNLEMVFVDGNPCWREDTSAERARFLSKLPSHVDKVDVPLRILNGYEISITERVEAVKLLKKEGGAASVTDIEAFRLALCFHRNRVSPEETTHLNLSGCSLKTLHGMAALPRLVHLDLSNNLLEALDADWLRHMPYLEYLDLRDNYLAASLADLLKTLSTCRHLRVLYLANCNRRHDTKRAKKYAHEVFAALPQVDAVDSIRNPARYVDNVDRRKRGSILEVFDIPAAGAQAAAAVSPFPTPSAPPAEDEAMLRTFGTLRDLASLGDEEMAEEVAWLKERERRDRERREQEEREEKLRKEREKREKDEAERRQQQAALAAEALKAKTNAAAADTKVDKEEDDDEDDEEEEEEDEDDIESTESSEEDRMRLTEANKPAAATSTPTTSPRDTAGPLQFPTLVVPSTFFLAPGESLSLSHMAASSQHTTPATTPRGDTPKPADDDIEFPTVVLTKPPQTAATSLPAPTAADSNAAASSSTSDDEDGVAVTNTAPTDSKESAPSSQTQVVLTGSDDTKPPLLRISTMNAKALADLMAFDGENIGPAAEDNKTVLGDLAAAAQDITLDNLQIYYQ